MGGVGWETGMGAHVREREDACWLLEFYVLATSKVTLGRERERSGDCFEFYLLAISIIVSG